jgi:predicted metal-dependent HD superfamily phosphohydrolase
VIDMIAACHTAGTARVRRDNRARGVTITGMRTLTDRWLAALPARVDRVAARRVGADLLARWAEPHRAYHTTEHLVFVLSVVDSHAHLAADADAVRLAAWFHDAVYDPQARDNEERSAVLASAALRELGAGPDEVAEVARLVRLTATHEVADGDRNGALLADADFATLAVPAPAYDRYTAAIRREYAHVPDEAFRAGRAAMLRRLADLPSLYRIVPERAAWTERARGNITRELRGLVAPTDGDHRTGP